MSSRYVGQGIEAGGYKAHDTPEPGESPGERGRAKEARSSSLGQGRSGSKDVKRPRSFGNGSMQIVFLGTSGSWPTPKRNVSAVAVKRGPEAVHTVPGNSYVLEEKTRPGRFSVDRAEALGIPTGPMYSKLQEGETVLVGDRTVRPEDVLGPPRRGRKIVYTGDTMPHDDLAEIARHADVLIHDATSDAALEEKANRYGHSSSRQAAEIAKEARVGLLVLTHLSPRYEEPTKILEDAKKIFENVRVAEDFAEIEVPYPE